MPFVDLSDSYVPLDSTRLKEAVFEGLAERFPGWEAAPGNLETALVEQLSEIAAELADVAVDVPPEIFRGFGEKIIGLAPQLALSATISSTWTMIDDAGYTIPANTPVALRVSGSDLVGFITQSEVLVAAGDTETAAGEVVLVAAVPGTAPNGLTDLPVELLDNLAYVDSIETVGTVSGGVDEEDPDAYLDRLADDLRTLSPRPILPEDFAILARNVAGVWRAVAVDGYDPGTNEVQTISETGTPTSGSFTLTYSGQTTGSIAWNASASTIKTALEALSNIAVDDVQVTGGPLPTPVVVEFRNALGAANVSQMTVTDSVTGGDATVSTTTGGVAPSTGNERMVAVAAIDETGTGVDSTVRTAIDELLEAERETNFVVSVIQPTVTQVKVSATAVALPGYDPDDVETAIAAAISNYLSPAGWGVDLTGQDPRAWRNVTTVRRFELISLVDRVPGVDYVSALTLAKQADSLATSDVTLTGVAPLPSAGTITASVS